MVPDVHRTVVANARANKTGRTGNEAGQRHTTRRCNQSVVANLFLHYAMDKWLEQTHSTVRYVRYADDAILHCKSKVQADYVLRNLNKRMKQCGLELHPKRRNLFTVRDLQATRRPPNGEVRFSGLLVSTPHHKVEKEQGSFTLAMTVPSALSSKKRIAER
jgi:RNA-directed DNA polymerase